MDEYIDREVALSLIQPYAPEDGQSTVTIATAKKLVRSIVYRTPAADVEPVRHGRWIPLTECANEGVYCSICKKKVWKSDYAQCSKKSRNKLESNYCPFCGAKMDEKED